MPQPPDMIQITPTAEVTAGLHGSRAKCLQRLVRLDLPVPLSVALSSDTVHGLAEGHLPDIARLCAIFDEGDLLSVRARLSQRPQRMRPGSRAPPQATTNRATFGASA